MVGSGTPLSVIGGHHPLSSVVVGHRHPLRTTFTSFGQASTSSASQHPVMMMQPSLPPPPPSGTTLFLRPSLGFGTHHHQYDDIIEELDTSSGGSSGHPSPIDLTDVPEVAEYPTMEPIIIRGNGNMTLFGLSNTFSSEFPSVLVGRVSREEFEATLSRVNHLLRQHHSTNAKLLFLGCLCCCCSFGCSLLWPTLALSKRTRTALEKLIVGENHRLYHRLGLNWKLSKERCHSNYAFMEYVLVIDFLPKLHLYQPD